MLLDSKKVGNMTWNCAAIDHGVTIFPNGKIGPCCQVSADYLKPISMIRDSNKFSDLKTETPPSACHYCILAESNNLPSYRQMFNSFNNNMPGTQFVDIRHTNQCNLKCRYCGPHFRSQWAKELNHSVEIKTQSIADYKDVIVSDTVHWMYFTGGEPLILGDHWDILEELIQKNLSKHIKLVYNTNLTTLKYKDKDIIDIWKNFDSVEIRCSIDAIGEPLEYIRSGSNWLKIKNNIESLLSNLNNTNIKLSITPVLSILNLWFVDKLFEFANENKIPVSLMILHGPDYLGLNVIPDQLKDLALAQVEKIKKYILLQQYRVIVDLITNNINQCLFQHTLRHVMLLDNLREENLFKLLPFKDVAVDTTLKNYEYE
jgi:sulfatase maturation enzyme AslB (radical SAM superfamily)